MDHLNYLNKNSGRTMHELMLSMVNNSNVFSTLRGEGLFVNNFRSTLDQSHFFEQLPKFSDSQGTVGLENEGVECVPVERQTGGGARGLLEVAV